MGLPVFSSISLRVYPTMVGLGGWNGLDQAQELLGVGNVGEAHFSVWRFHFQTVSEKRGRYPFSPGR